MGQNSLSSQKQKLHREYLKQIKGGYRNIHEVMREIDSSVKDEETKHRPDVLANGAKISSSRILQQSCAPNQLELPLKRAQESQPTTSDFQPSTSNGPSST